MPAQAEEKREARRFHLRYPISVRWTNPVAGEEESASTRDISACGVYLVLEKAQQERETEHVGLGDEIEFDLLLPRDITGEEPNHVRYRGNVVRVEPSSEGKLGIGARLTAYQLIADAEDDKDFANPSEKRWLHPFYVHRGGLAQNAPRSWLTRLWPEAPREYSRELLVSPFPAVRNSNRLLALLLALAAAWLCAGFFQQRWATTQVTPAPSGAMVWADGKTGLYLCPGTERYGDGKQGRFMSEAEAKADGFHPTAGRGCR